MAEEKSWQSVPVEATDIMLAAGNKASLSIEVLMSDTRFACERAFWKAMLAVAPQPAGWQQTVRDAIEAIERGSSTAPVVEALKALLAASPSQAGGEPEGAMSDAYSSSYRTHAPSNWIQSDPDGGPRETIRERRPSDGEPDLAIIEHLEHRIRGYKARGDTIYNGKIIAEELLAVLAIIQAKAVTPIPCPKCNNTGEIRGWDAKGNLYGVWTCDCPASQELRAVGGNL